VKRFLLSDLHIGHEGAQYKVMEQAITYIRQNAQVGDEIWGLGDWWHMYENGFRYCLHHPMTQQFLNMARIIPTKLVPGNHDHELEKYRDNPALGNPISPIDIVKPFMDKGIWYCHGHEYDPSVQYIPKWLIWLWNQVTHKITPGNLKRSDITQRYIMLVHLVHSRALINLNERAQKEGVKYKGIVMGHTHLPLHQESPDLLFLLNDGDMRHSSTFTMEDDNEFHQMQWNSAQKLWRVISFPKP
jgi:UDP-2,3-diacylglucosamine pyrophosphatase LpxH